MKNFQIYMTKVILKFTLLNLKPLNDNVRSYEMITVLSTKNQISEEILSNAGFFCKNTVDDIKNGLIKIIKNKKHLKSKIRRGVKISKKFKWKLTSKNFLSF